MSFKQLKSMLAVAGAVAALGGPTLAQASDLTAFKTVFNTDFVAKASAACATTAPAPST